VLLSLIYQKENIYDVHKLAVIILQTKYVLSIQVKSMKNIIIVVVVAVIGLSGGYFFNQYLGKIDTDLSESSSQSTHRPDFALKDINGKLRHAKEWDGKVLLINFWASWCPPCVREIPDFVRLHESYKDKGFDIIGIALDEEQSVIDFIDPIGVDYPILIATDSGIALSQAYGNRLGVLPFSVIVDRKGNIVSSHRSELSYEGVEQLIKPLL